MPNLRGRKDPQDHEREQRRSRINHDAKSDDEFDFGSAEEAEGGSMEESVSECEGSRRRKEQKSAKHGGDEANKGEHAKTKTWSDIVKGLKTEDKLEITNSDVSRNQLETTVSDQLKDMRRKGKRKSHHYRDNKDAEKGRTSIQADQKGRSTWNHTDRVARVWHEARRNQTEDPEE